MKSPIPLILLSASITCLMTGCGFKSDLYLADITPVPDTVITDFPTLPTLPSPDGAGASTGVDVEGVVVEIPVLEDDVRKKGNN